MIIPYSTDEGANRGPQKPTEAKPLSVSDFSRDGKRTDITDHLQLLPGPVLERLPTLPYHTLIQPQGILSHFLPTAKSPSPLREPE